MAVERKVLVSATNYSQYCMPARKLLERQGFVVEENPFGRPFTRDELLERVEAIDAAVVGPDVWDEAVMARAPRLKLITRFGVGVDNIDLRAAAARGMTVCNARGENAVAVAEQAVGMILCLLRDIPRLDAQVRLGAWPRVVGRNLGGKTVGLLGFGDIARKVAARLAAFDVKLTAYDKYPDKAAAETLGVKLDGMDGVLAGSDIVSLHLPALPETTHIIGRAAFEAMRPGAWFVNTSRGALVDEAALVAALKSGRLAGAALDVYEGEPLRADNPLCGLANTVLTPHTAGDTVETYHNVGMLTAQMVIDYFDGKTPVNRLTET